MMSQRWVLISQHKGCVRNRYLFTILCTTFAFHHFQCLKWASMACGIFHNPTMQCSVNCITAECLSVMTPNDDDKKCLKSQFTAHVMMSAPRHRNINESPDCYVCVFYDACTWCHWICSNLKSFQKHLWLIKNATRNKLNWNFHPHIYLSVPK